MTLRDSYARKYNWAKQTKELVDRMINLAHGGNVDYLSFNGTLSGNDRKTKQKKCDPLQVLSFNLEKMVANTYMYAFIRKNVTLLISLGTLFSAEWSMDFVCSMRSSHFCLL